MGTTPLFHEDRDKVALGDLVRDLFRKVGEYNRAQVELAKAELRLEGQKLGVTVVLGVVAVLAGFVAMQLFALSVLMLLSLSIHPVWAAFITAGLFLLLTGLVVFAAVKEMKKDTATMDVEKPVS